MNPVERGRMMLGLPIDSHLTPPTRVDHVHFTAACPGCGQDCQWVAYESGKSSSPRCRNC